MRSGARALTSAPSGRKLASALVAGAIAWMLAAPLPAEAAPSVSVSVSPTGTVAGDLQVRSRASSPLGLNWVQLEGYQGSWKCLRRWSQSGQSNFDETITWDSNRWIATGCSSDGHAGQQTLNGTFKFRVRAQDIHATSTSEDVTVQLNNPATKPEWNSDPDHEQAEDGDPLVVFSFTGSPDPDVVEYRYYRTDPDGEQWFTAIDPGSPGEADCERADDVYQCVDGVFPASGYGGSYVYELETFRASPAGGSGCNCIGSGRTESRTVSVPEPTPSPSPSPSPTTSPSPDGDDGGTGGSGGGIGRRHVPQRVLGRRQGGSSNSEFFSGSFDRNLPFQDRNILIPGLGNRRAQNELAIGVEGDDNRKLAIPIAAGLLLFLGAAHARRLLSVR